MINAHPMAIAGIGAVTGYGWGTECLWKGLLSGKPAATLVPGYGLGAEQPAWLAARETGRAAARDSPR